MDSIKMIRILLVLLVCCFFNIPAKADNLPFRHIDVSNGLLNNRIWTMQPLDNHTYLVAYPYTFAVFDGSQSHFCNIDLEQTYIINGYEARSFRDAKGRVWLKKYTTLNVYDQETHSFLPHIQQLWKSSGLGKIDDILFDSEGFAWLYTKGKLYSYDWEHKAKLIYSLAKREQEKGILPIHVVKSGHLVMIIFSNGLIRRFYADKLVAEDNRFLGGNHAFQTTASLLLGQGKVLLGLGGDHAGLMVYSMKTGQAEFLDKTSTNYLSILSHFQDGYYVISSHEVLIYSKDFVLQKRIQGASFAENFNSQPISSSSLDWQGGLWISTFVGGIYYYHPLSYHCIYFPVRQENINKYLVDLMNGQRKHLIYSTTSSLVNLNLETGEEEILYHHPKMRIQAMSKDKKGNVWLSTQHGIMLYHQGQGIEKQYSGQNLKGLPKDQELCRFAISENGKVFCAFGRHFVGWFHPQDSIFHHIEVSNRLKIAQQDYWNVAYDEKKHRLLIVGDYNLISWDEKSGNLRDLGKYIKQQYRVFSRANHVMVDSKGRYFISAQDGLYLITSEGDVKRFSADDGLSKGAVCATIEMGKNKYAISTSNGLATFYLNAKNEIQVFSYDLSRITDGREMKIGALGANHNFLWCSSFDGIYGVVPNRDEKANLSFHYVPILVNVSVMDKNVTSDGFYWGKQVVSYKENTINLAHDENFIKLCFSACNYIAMPHTIYRYQLEGVDNKWVERSSETGVLDIAYTNLGFGKYQLKVQVLDNDGKWSPSEVWTIHIFPPIWLTWWAILLYIIIGVGLVTGSYYLWRERHYLIKMLKEKRNHFIVQAKDVKAEDIKITPENELFLKKAAKFVENNLQNADYNVEALSADLCLNRSHLFRRLKTISGLSPMEFIRTIRLRRGAQLLLESGMTISEIAYLCGFNSPTLFRKYFKEMYGMTPSEYLALRQTDGEL